MVVYIVIIKTLVHVISLSHLLLLLLLLRRQKYLVCLRRIIKSSIGFIGYYDIINIQIDLEVLAQNKKADELFPL